MLKKPKRSVTMYNMIFPIFLLLWPPMLLMLPTFGEVAGRVWLLAILLGNLLLDWLVTALALRWQKIPEIKNKSLAVLVRVWLVGFAADFFGGLPLLVIMLVDNDGWLYENVHKFFYTSIFRSPYALAITLACVLLAGWLIYSFNKNWALEPAELTEPQRKRTALVLALLTAPWLFLLPANWFYYI